MAVTAAKPEARTGLSVVHSPMARCLYVYGGSKNRKWFSDVYMVDADNWSWQCIKVRCLYVVFTGPSCPEISEIHEISKLFEIVLNSEIVQKF